MSKNKKPRNKKYDKFKLRDDFIPFYEHQTGIFARYFKEFRHMLATKCTMHNLINEGIMLYRFSFLYEIFNPDISAQPIRDIIEKYINSINSDSCNEDVIPFNLEEKELILMMIEGVEENLISIRSRKVYAQYSKDMIVNMNLHVGLLRPELKKYIDYDNSNASLRMCEKRINADLIIKNKKDGKLAMYTEDNSITFIKKNN